MMALTKAVDAISVAGNWPAPLRDWFCQLIMDQPKKPVEVPIIAWKTWLKLVEEHGLASLIFSRLQKSKAGIRPPVEIYNSLRKIYLAEVARIMVRQTQLRNLLKWLAAAQIAPLVLKGAALGEVIYQDVFQRPTADIDILVAKADYEKARKVLLENGYRSKRGDRSQEMNWTCDEEFLPAADVEERQFVVELHWTMISHAQLVDKIDTIRLFERSEAVGNLSNKMQVLSAVDSLVFACLHLFYKHIKELRLIWLYDIHLLAEKIEALGLWHETVALSQEWQARLALKNCLELAHEWFGTTVPEFVSNESYMPAEIGEVELFNMIMFQLENGRRQGWIRKHLYQIRRLKGWNKIRYLNSRLFPSRQEIEANYPVLRLWPGPLVHIGRFALMFVTKR